MPQTEPAPSRSPLPKAAAHSLDANALAGIVAMVALAALTAMLLRGFAPVESIDLVFLVSVLFSAVLFGFRAGLIASALALLAFDFLFVEPELTFRVARTQDMVSLTAFVLVAALTGSLAGRLREQALAARERARLLEHLSDLSNELLAATSEEEAREALQRALRRMTGRGVMIVDRTLAADPPLSPDDLQAAEKALRLGAPQTGAAAGWAGGRHSFYPLVKGGEGALAAGVQLAGFAPELYTAAQSAAGQTGAVISRLRLAGKVVQAQLKAEREGLRAAVLSSLSHDLKTPLATILGSVTTLRQFTGALPQTAREDLLQAIEEDARRLNIYVGDLLHMTRLQSGLDPRLDWVDPRDLLNGAVARLRRDHPDRTVEVTAGDGLPLIRTDAALLEQALFNCLDNAAGIAPGGTNIRASAQQRDSAVTFAVEDRGPGVPPEYQALIFEPFQRGPAPKAGGTGLGLAIAKGIVLALGGSIGVESPISHGLGARFSLSVPIDRESAA